MKARYGLLLVALLAIAAQLGNAQGGWPPPDHMGLMFVSQPLLFGRVDVPYMYTAVAHAKDSIAVVHYFSDPFDPQGFSIDSVTGVVTWTPTVPGWYPVTILAHASNGERGAQRFMVAVTKGNGIVQGKVTDTAGVGIPNVVIEILQAGNVSSTVFGCYSFATRTDQNGNYRLSNIDPGQYLLHAVSPTPQYMSQWYDGKATAFDADRITVVDSPGVTFANFVLRGGIMPMPLITVSGSVQDTANNPLKQAEVFFVRAGFALNSNSTVDDFRGMFDLDGRFLDFHLDGHSPHVFRAVTDSLGAYSLKVIPGTFIAFARARGYMVSFYLNESDPLTADRLMLTKDTTGIDFVLHLLPPVALGTISGSVLDSATQAGVRSRIIAFRNRWSAPDAYPHPRTYTVDTDSLGAYTLKDLLPGSYFVLALPMGNYAPAFYSSDTSTMSWRHATPVVVNGNDVTGIDIDVREIPSLAHGFTGIAGTIHPDSQPESAAAGTIVYAQWNSTVAGFGIADETGHFEIAGLAPGTYTVSADLPGFDPQASKTATASYTPQGVPVFGSVDLSLSAVVSSVADPSSAIPEKFALSQNYPNPFNPSTQISYQLPATEKVDLRVFDILGREVAVLASGVQSAGQHSVKFDAVSLSSGVYFYRLSAGSSVATMKMLLLK